MRYFLRPGGGQLHLAARAVWGGEKLDSQADAGRAQALTRGGFRAWDRYWAGRACSPAGTQAQNRRGASGISPTWASFRLG